jgi:hypothetical protein
MFHSFKALFRYNFFRMLSLLERINVANHIQTCLFQKNVQSCFHYSEGRFVKLFIPDSFSVYFHLKYDIK